MCADVQKTAKHHIPIKGVETKNKIRLLLMSNICIRQELKIKPFNYG